MGTVPEVANAWRISAMSKLAWIVVFATLAVAPAAAQQSAIPDLRGTWKGNSESIILGAGNPHHAAAPSDQLRLNSVAFTATIDKQDGRRFSGTFSSPNRTGRFPASGSRTRLHAFAHGTSCPSRHRRTSPSR